ncbi:hypothetical protein [Chitinolyticbacter meiyuanensis]|uniref:hypothetical protein n=1 Tax=Chitinolyticbacter meiyuanensis TaxID=682798 RepID=UPI0011E5F9D3|nr:hypothetical protein [Chitinolyticbacter meiyuanensis]
MNWEPTTETELWDKIIQAETRMDAEQSRLWELLKVMPMKWQQHPYGDAGGGFWVVGLIGSLVVWLNDIEDGFNVSQYRTFGCNQDDLELVVQSIADAILRGYSFARCGPPQNIEPKS